MFVDVYELDRPWQEQTKQNKAQGHFSLTSAHVKDVLIF